VARVKYKNCKLALLKSLLLIAVAMVMVFTVFMVLTPAVAAPNDNANDNAKDRPKVTIPENAVEIAPGVFNTGQAKDVDGKTVEGLMFIHYKKGFEHKPNHPSKPNKGGGGESNCYSLTKGFNWDEAEPYVVDTTNTDGLDAGYIKSILATSMSDWNTYAKFTVFGSLDGSTTVDDYVPNLDGKNEIWFGDIESPGAIAVTYLWGVWWGNPNARYIAEYDIVYDDTDFFWIDATKTSEKKINGQIVEDFHNLSAHELGHAGGLSHPEDSCNQETMYRFASAGEIKKRDLNDGDITGIKNLYK